MASNNITPSQIVEHRAQRKRCGLVGCISGRPKPEMDFFGYKDVQIWFRDASGRLNGDPEFNRRDPYCFCFDCRGSFDPEGTLDAELVNEGHERACEVYASLLPKKPVVTSPLPAREVFFEPSYLPQRSMTHYPGVLSCERGCHCGHWEREDKNVVAAGGAPPPPPMTPPHSPRVFSEPPRLPPRIVVPNLNESTLRISLPAPRHRDFMNETRETRLRKDLLEHLMDLRSEIITIMDHRRNGVYYEGEERAAFLEHWERKENEEWEKIRAAELLIHSLDA